MGEESDAPSSSGSSSEDTPEIQITSPRERSFSYELKIKELASSVQPEPYIYCSMIYSPAAPSRLYYFKIYENKDGLMYPDKAVLCSEENGKTETLAELKGTQAYVQLTWGNRRGVYWLAGDEQAVYCYAFDTKSVSKLELPDKVGYFTLSDDFLVYSVFLEPDDTSVTLRYLSLSGGSPKTVEATLMNPYYVPDIVDDTIAVPLLENGRYSMVIYDLSTGEGKNYPLPEEVENLLSIQTNGTTAILTSLKTPSDYTSSITRIYHIPTERVIRQFRGLNHSFERAFFVNDIQVIYCAENNEVWLYDITTNYCTPVQELSGKQYHWMYGNILIGNSDIAVITS